MYDELYYTTNNIFCSNIARETKEVQLLKYIQKKPIHKIVENQFLQTNLVMWGSGIICSDILSSTLTLRTVQYAHKSLRE